MNPSLDKQITVWRGNATPPTNYHLWIKEDGTAWYWKNTKWTLLQVTKNVTKDEVKDILDSLLRQLYTKANIESPTFTGVPAAPTPETSDNSNKIATTKFVLNAVSAKVNETLDTVNVKFSLVNADLKTVNTKIQGIIATNNSLDTKINKLETKATSLEAVIANNTKAISEVKANVTKLEKNVTNVSNSVNALTKYVNSSIEGVNGKIESLKSEVLANTEGISVNSQNIENLSTKIDGVTASINSKFQEIEEKIKDKESSISVSNESGVTALVVGTSSVVVSANDALNAEYVSEQEIKISHKEMSGITADNIYGPLDHADDVDSLEVPSIRLDKYGHVAGISAKTLNLKKDHASEDTTYGAASSDKYGHVKIQDTLEKDFEGKYIKPTASGVAASTKMVYEALAGVLAMETPNIRIDNGVINESLKGGFTFGEDFEYKNGRITLRWDEYLES